jgi:hypothetical protein
MGVTPDPVEIIADERGQETHPSWIAIRANRVSHSPPGKRLHDSEIRHQHYVVVTVHRMRRHRDLNHDWHSEYGLPLIEMSMSMAQWGAFVSSFGDGTGVPVTLDWDGNDYVPSEPENTDSRLALSAAETKNATAKAIESVQEAEAAVMAAFEAKAGRREMAALLHTLHHRIANMPANAKFAADSLTKHTENVVTKARFDIEAMVAQHAKTLGLDAQTVVDALALNPGDQT